LKQGLEDAAEAGSGIRAAAATRRLRAWFMFVTDLSGLECPCKSFS
jgi:hypothetical protein